MEVRFLTIAQEEVDEAFRWIEERAEGKVFEFLDELDRVVRLIRTFPLVTVEIEPEIRRSLLARFPYALVYGIDAQGRLSGSISTCDRLGGYPQITQITQITQIVFDGFSVSTSRPEFDSLRSQIVISKGHGGRRSLAHAFIEQGRSWLQI